MPRLGRRQPGLRGGTPHPAIVSRGRWPGPGTWTPPSAVGTPGQLAGGAGTRSFGAVTTQAGDWLVVEVVTEGTAVLATVTPTAAGLTFVQQNSIAPANHTVVQHYTAPDATGGSRTVTMTPSGGSNPTTSHYAARLTVVRGSGGPGGKATSGTAEYVLAARQQDNSMLFMTVGDWAAGAPGTPTWAPSGVTTSSQQDGSAATYVFGRLDDAGVVNTENSGLATPLFATPTVAVLEMLGAFAGPPVRPLSGPVRPRIPSPTRGGWTASRAGVFTSVAVVSGPPVYPLGHPVQARQLPQRGGTADSHVGTFAGTGPPVEPLAGPVGARVRVSPSAGRAVGRDGAFGGVGPAIRQLDGPVTAPRPQPARGGRAASRAGVFTATTPTTGPPVYPLKHPVQARQLPLRGGDITRGVGPYAGTGPALRPADGPVQARRLAASGGRVASRDGVLTAGAPQAGPPLYPMDHPVQPRQQPQRGGRTAHTAGPYAGVGPAVRAADSPVRAQPAPARGGRVVGRVGTLTVSAPQVGPPVYPLHRPVAARRLPARGGCTAHRAGSYAGTGPAAPQLRQSVARGRQQPPPPTRGRTASLHGAPQGSGPPLRALQRPVRARRPGPVRFGRTWMATAAPLTHVCPPPTARPIAGTTVRPSTGTTTRTAAGTANRPTAGMTTRPDTGTTPTC